MVAVRKLHVVTCDRCGTKGEFEALSIPGALRVARAAGWVQGFDRRLRAIVDLCEGCFEP
jgi:hypothetical protein